MSEDRPTFDELLASSSLGQIDESAVPPHVHAYLDIMLSDRIEQCPICHKGFKVAAYHELWMTGTHPRLHKHEVRPVGGED